MEIIFKLENIFKDFKNVTYKPLTNDVKSIYSKTKILLVPSLWEEAFGRVVIESFLNGIPVISSDTGALPNTLNNAGFCLKINKITNDNYNIEQDITEWINIIEKLSSTKFYNFISKKCIKASEKYYSSFQNSYKEFKEYILTI